MGNVICYGGLQKKLIHIRNNSNFFEEFTILNKNSNRKVSAYSKKKHGDVIAIYNRNKLISFESHIEYLPEHDYYILFAKKGSDNDSNEINSISRFKTFSEVLTQEKRNSEVETLYNYCNQFEIDVASFDDIIVDSNTSITFSDINGIALWCNDNFIQLTGRTRSEIIGKRPRDSMYGKKSVYIDKRFVDSNVTKGKPFYFENIAYHSSGKEYWFSAKVYPISNSNNEICARVHIINDITDLNTSALELEKNETLLKLAMDTALAGIWTYNLATKELELSPELRKILNIDSKEADDTASITNMIDKRDRISLYKKIYSSININNNRFDTEIRIKIKHVVYYYHLRCKCLMFDSNGKPILLIGTISDITVFKEIINKINHQKEFYHSILDNIPADIVIWDKDHKYVYINKQAIKNDSTRHWLIGKDDFDYCKKKNWSKTVAEERRQQFFKMIADKNAIKFVEKFEGDSPIYKLRIMYPIIKGGNVNYVIGYGIDITEQVENEKKALFEQEQMRLLMDVVNDAVVRVNTNGDVLSYNKMFLNLFNLLDSDCVNTSLCNILPVGVCDYIKKGLTDMAASKSQINGRVEFSKTSKTIILDYALIPVHYQGISTYIVKFNDVTESETAQEKLKALVEKETQINKYKSQFIRITSHDLRTPLAIVKSNAELIDYYINHPETQKDFQPNIDNIQYQVDSITELLDRLLLVGRMETGDVILNIKRVNVTDYILRNIILPYTPYTDGRNLSVNISKEIEYWSFDPILIKVSLQNLLNNAFKYSRDTPPVLNLSIDNNNLKFEVIDLGIGIPEADVASLFTTFQRASNVSHIMGSGIGLSIVDFIVKKHGGQVQIDSELGKGTIATITLPYLP